MLSFLNSVLFPVSNNWFMFLFTPFNVNWWCPHTAALGVKPALLLTHGFLHKPIHYPLIICTKFVHRTLPTRDIPVSS